MHPGKYRKQKGVDDVTQRPPDLFPGIDGLFTQDGETYTRHALTISLDFFPRQERWQ